MADPFVAPLTPGAQTGALIRVDPSTGNTDTFMNGFAPLGIAVEDAERWRCLGRERRRMEGRPVERRANQPDSRHHADRDRGGRRQPAAGRDRRPLCRRGRWHPDDPRDGVLANDSDPDGDTLTAGLVDGRASGVLDLDADGGFTYMLSAGFLGDVMFTYGASDGRATSDPATVTLEVRDTIAPMVTINQAAGRRNRRVRAPSSSTFSSARRSPGLRPVTSC